MTAAILNEAQQQWLSDVRRQVGALQTVLARFPATHDDEETLRRAAQQMEELFLLVVVGEFNAGKSVFVNALLGSRVLEEGAVPTTSKIGILEYGESLSRKAADEASERITAPVELLREVRIVDTPGANAIERKHEAITQEFIPRADLVFFVTSADRPFTESEHQFLERIREWGKKIVYVVNKIDILEDPDDLRRIEEFVKDNAKKLTGVQSEVFAVAARPALRAKTGGEAPEEYIERFRQIERYVVETLDQEERVRLKLLNPLGVARRIAEKYLQIIDERLDLLQQDLQAIEEIENHLNAYKEDMQRGFRLRLADVDNILHAFESRGHEFIDETVRLARVFDLVNKSRIKAEFERKVVADAPEQIEKKVESIIDWLIASDLQQWQFLRDHLARRRSQHSQQTLGDGAGRFDYDRNRLMETVGRAAQRTLENYDKRRESLRMAESVQNAVANTALIEVGAVGLGTIVSLAATSTAADVTGLLAAGVMATLGFLVIPQRRRAANKELRKKISELRESLMSALTSQFDREIEHTLERLSEGIAPYTRFVRGERSSLVEKQAELKAVRDELARLQAEIERPAKA